MSPEAKRDIVSSRHIRDFAAVTRRLIHGSDLFLDEGAIVEVLVNPASGLLKTGYAHRKMMRHLNRLADARRTSDSPRNGLEVRFHETDSRSHAGEKAVELVRDLAESTKEGRRVLVTAGGDGFHNDVCTALLLTVPDIMKDIVLFRLPMGTGNDNADASTVEEAFAILGSAVGTKKDAVIQAGTARGAVHYAFNVVSFGMDAYVCELTNKMKNLAGPKVVYKLFADVAVLLYEKLWPLKPWSVTISGPGVTERRQGRFLLTVFGSKGDTRYGGGMKVLPGEENFLLVTPLTLMGKMRIKPLFYRGAHRGLPIAELFVADSVELSHEGAILMETDGEVVPLEPADFPLVIKRIPDVLSILK
ncbi:MAG: diacylglycerol kinase family protein [Spirochaetaceae bacterium]|nr:diacylglycerol kinase family protein [Spirochaetaceae bacterium]